LQANLEQSDDEMTSNTPAFLIFMLQLSLWVKVPPSKMSEWVSGEAESLASNVSFQFNQRLKRFKGEWITET
jgi:hypothetical protein